MENPGYFPINRNLMLHKTLLLFCWIAIKYANL